MSELRTMTESQLVDQLAHHTASYFRMIADGATDEDYARCNLTIRAIQQEIEFRRKDKRGRGNGFDFNLNMPPEYTF